MQPGSVHDITAARAHGVLGALYPAAAAGMPTLADKGYTGTGIGVLVPTKGANLAPDNLASNLLVNVSRAPAERANAPLKSGRGRTAGVRTCSHKTATVCAVEVLW